MPTGDAYSSGHLVLSESPSLWDLHMFYLLRPIPFPNFSLFSRTMLFGYPSVLSRFCFTSLILKVLVSVQNIQKVCNHLYNTQSPSLIFKIIAYNFNTILDIPVPKSQEKELSCRQSFSSKLVQNITILHIF